MDFKHYRLSKFSLLHVAVVIDMKGFIVLSTCILYS